MDKERLKDITRQLRKVLNDLESEVYSDPSKYLEDVVHGVQVEDDDGNTD